MPCVSWDDPPTPNSADIKKKLDETTALLCQLCESCDANRISFPPEVGTWWTKHKEEDRKRIESEIKTARERLSRAQVTLETDEKMVEILENQLAELGRERAKLLSRD